LIHSNLLSKHRYAVVIPSVSAVSTEFRFRPRFMQ
jgi:hypothetical protein